MSTVIKIVTSDNKIWNKAQIFTDIALAMSFGNKIILDFLCEAPDAEQIGIYNFLYSLSQKFKYDLTKVTIVTSNALEKHHTIDIKYLPPIHLLHNTNEYFINLSKKDKLKHFGMFVGRSNAPRLYLASYLDDQYRDKSIYTYHFNKTDDFHLYNIGLDDLVQTYNISDLTTVSNFLKKCPIMLSNGGSVKIDKSLPINPAQQLLKSDKNIFSSTYQHFFVEIVCESYYTGNTFFTTEKILRPMLLKTPFIVQGPKNFLKNLKKLGFLTFEHWWDEGYSQDHSSHQIHEIKKVIDDISTRTFDELTAMYNEMQEVLNHNYKKVLSLDSQDFKDLHDQ